MTKSINAILLLIIIVLLSASCNTSPHLNSGSNKNDNQDSLVSKNADKKEAIDFLAKFYSLDNLYLQTFTINSSIDNLITGENGTILRINKGTFVDENNKVVKGKVEISLIEVLEPINRVLGNLTTTFNGQPLETGGMIEVNATARSKKISIGANKFISVKMPVSLTLPGMSVFEGQPDSSGVKWANPVKLPLVGRNDTTMVSFERTSNVYYNVDGYKDTTDIPRPLQYKVGDIAWTGDGLKIPRDTVIRIDGYTVHLIKGKLRTYRETYYSEKGVNSFIEDRKTNYIFSLKKLGWANIDRLMEDKRTKPVDLVTSIENEKDFKFIYVTMITDKMYLPGYQKKDETFCFSHDDEEKQQLPVGETATILATTYKNGKPWFALQKFVISDKQTISFKLKETTAEALKAYLKQNI